MAVLEMVVQAMVAGARAGGNDVCSYLNKPQEIFLKHCLGNNSMFFRDNACYMCL